MRANIDFRNYTGSDYEALCSFLIALNENDDRNINWNWARLEWMIEHPEFDNSLGGMNSGKSRATKEII